MDRTPGPQDTDDVEVLALLRGSDVAHVLPLTARDDVYIYEDISVSILGKKFIVFCQLRLSTVCLVLK